MKQLLLLSFLCVSWYPVIDSARHHRRKAADNDEFVWGNADETNDNRQRLPTSQRNHRTTTERQETDEEIRASIDVCQPYNPEMPDYSKPGRRISQVKCLEVIWNIKRRYEEQTRERNCFWAIQARKNLFGGDEVGGRHAKDGEFPHMAAVGWKAAEGTWVFKCGATLISDKFVMTAGHCIKVSDRDETVSDPVPRIIRIGDNSILDPDPTGRRYNAAIDRNITRIIKHPAYKSPSVYNDIALMELDEPVTFRYNIHPACLWGPRNLTRLGSQATSTGWGVIETVKHRTSPDLQVTVLDLIATEQCDTLLAPKCNRKFCRVQRTQLCAGKLEGGVDSCQGDSGGPLQMEIHIPKMYNEKLHYVVGVTSFGFGCGRANTPGVYTRVSSYIDWIEQTVWGVHGVQRS